MNSTITCAISGLPICKSNEAVAIPIEEERYKGTTSKRFRYIPSDWPTFGKYDGDVSLDDIMVPQQSIYIHRAVWENYTLFWHPSNRFTAKWLNVEAALPLPSPSNYENPTDMLYYKLRE
jgi:hypothetical protein